MESRLVRKASRRPLATYGVAVVAPILAFLLRLPFTSLLGEKVPYITFFLATAVTATFGGLWPGLVTTALGALLTLRWILPPTGTFTFRDPGDASGFVLFLAISSFISYLAGRLIESRKHENALRLLFQQTLVSIGDALISVDEEQRVRLMNPVAQRLTGWNEGEVKGRPISEVLCLAQEDTNMPAEIPVEEVFRTGAVARMARQTELITRSGERISIEDSAAPIRDEAGRVAGAVLVFRDIRDKRRTERELIAAERHARTILDSISDAFLLLDPEWRVVQVNPAAETMTGLSAVSLIGQIVWEMDPVIIGSSSKASLSNATAEGLAVHLENHYEPSDRWYDISAYPSSEGLAVYFRDITDRKRDEAALVRLNNDLTQFTYAATHDLREPLRMITIYAQILQRKLGSELDRESNDHFANIIGSAQRMARLVDGLLNLTRAGESETTEPTPVDSQAALKQALDNLQLAITETKAEIAYDPLPNVLGHPTYICQTFQNLVANALKYHMPGTTPKVHVSATRNGTHHIFAVRDNGIGIAPEDQEKIFVPFRRLHGSEIEGSGIGLATCKRIVERYGGRIWVKSKPGEGSTFYFSLAAPNQLASRYG